MQQGIPPHGVPNRRSAQSTALRFACCAHSPPRGLGGASCGHGHEAKRWIDAGRETEGPADLVPRRPSAPLWGVAFLRKRESGVSGNPKRLSQRGGPKSGEGGMAMNVGKTFAAVLLALGGLTTASAALADRTGRRGGQAEAPASQQG